MGRADAFRSGAGQIQDYLGPSKASAEPPDDFSLPPEQEAYYRGSREGSEHREKLKSLKGQAAKNEYLRGIREGLKENDRPRRGDLDNPLKKDMPKPPPQPRQPRAVNPVRKAQSRAARFGKLARMASGKRR